jgi:hypothetical protein
MNVCLLSWTKLTHHQESIPFIFDGQTHPWVVPTRDLFKEWLEKQKWPNHFPRPFPLNVLTTIIIFFHVY